MIEVYLALVLLGLAFGSFVNALVWRLHEQSKSKRSSKKLSIINGRSICPNCKHILAWYDLIPILSWLSLSGKCRYCHKPISAQYPVVEMAMAVVFGLSYAFWPTVISGGQWVLFVSWLAAAVGLMALLVYDARWMLLPNKLIYPTLLVAAAGRVIYLIGWDDHRLHDLLLWLAAVAVASGIFWAIYMAAEHFKRQWIGYGDVRLGLITGTLLATPAKAFLMIFMASVIGVVFIVPALAVGKKTLTSKLPYGPFLITAAGVTLLFGQSLIDWYTRVFLP